MFEKNRWQAAWKLIGVSAPETLLAELIARYSEPGRYYHTLQHLAECFAAMDSARHLAARAAEIELALWFHDAHYDSRAGDNEEKSADWAERSLLVARAAESVAARVRSLVLATKHVTIPEGADAKLLVDIDLSILGAPEDRFAEYERQVRQEYAWVPDEAFRQGRAQVLASFLERPSIYSTSWFVERLEGQARRNLERSLRELAG